ncbi:MAG: thymidine phosphorylase [Proteobacteria bacterium]|nr:thymidine phosphorylase [Pseudomonadota bacterium]
MPLVELIRAKRDGKRLSDEQLAVLIEGVTAGTVPDYQLAALLMAIYWRGLDAQELAALTAAMVRSGRVADLSAIALPKIDKHSTGGVGDKISLGLAPLVAACGVAVPMISGRGLGHTGGTLDKLAAIPGLRTDLDLGRFAAVLADAGLVLAGQSDALAPADRRLYALRDVTATVESIPLIAASIMSKKLAAGIDALVLDVKVGSGAFLKTQPRARALAQAAQAIGAAAGKRVTVVLSDMSQPLGCAIGNANELREALEVLRGGGPEDVWALTLALGTEMLLLGGVVSNAAEARARLEAARADGSGLARLRRCVALQGGDVQVIDDPRRLPLAAHARELRAEHDAVLAAIDCEAIGRAALRLGAGRLQLDDRIDPAVGLSWQVRLGQRVGRGELLATLHYQDEARARAAEALVRQALRWDEQPVTPPPLIHEVTR